MKRSLYATLNLRSLAICATGGAFLFCSVMALAIALTRRPLPTNAKINESFVIILDAGHGGIDGGAQSKAGLIEKEVNLSVTKKLNSMLRLLGYKTIMTRTEDEPTYDDPNASVRAKKVSDIKNRMSIVESHSNAIFVSIHQNNFTQSQYSGAQVFFSGNSDLSSVLAQSIQDSIVASLQPENKRQIKQCGTEVYLIYHCPIPGVMVECGFLSNPNEAALLGDKKYQGKMALAILNGILNYLGTETEYANQ